MASLEADSARRNEQADGRHVGGGDGNAPPSMVTLTELDRARAESATGAREGLGVSGVPRADPSRPLQPDGDNVCGDPSYVFSSRFQDTRPNREASDPLPSYSALLERASVNEAPHAGSQAVDRVATVPGGMSGGAASQPMQLPGNGGVAAPEGAEGAGGVLSNSTANNNTVVMGESFPTSDGESLESSVSEDITWISWFCSLKGNEFFCEVDDDFIQDDFNLTGLSSQVTYYNYALDTILDVDIPDGELDDRQQELVEVSAETLYGLIHARYILTARGMHAMLSKFNEGAYGRCPRVYCAGQPVLPVGQSDLPRLSTVKIFCPMCWDLFFPRSRHHNTLDGAYWGTSFPHLFLQTYPYLVPKRSSEQYVPRIFGFKIHKSSLPVQRNLGLNANEELS
eukprot:CAMPEP_0185856450 /NCGR_PEP_ID=MMETSP1354-20130828/29003_1 /TAXON_ID=708628 /ORGANISM="Erythrolobus madagascarensis, Strain CCMP3276" /LENGTH=397 /DNA_ID=CAMNT_0028558701 /DNA_START=25 /DNA_END=1218 /DNA_ORIENTATION=+